MYSVECPMPSVLSKGLTYDGDMIARCRERDCFLGYPTISLVGRVFEHHEHASAALPGRCRECDFRFVPLPWPVAIALAGFQVSL